MNDPLPAVTKNATPVVFRFAERGDCPVILRLIQDIAEYERLAHEVVATEELLSEWLFDKRAAEVMLAVVDGQEVGFALYFYNFSTFIGRTGMYLEDIYIQPEHRGQGIGRAMLRTLAKMAVERGCKRFEWTCLDWNTPAIELYRSIGAEPMSEWTTYRLSGNALTSFAEGQT